jgi:hypothetical protein
MFAISSKDIHNRMATYNPVGHLQNLIPSFKFVDYSKYVDNPTKLQSLCDTLSVVKSSTNIAVLSPCNDFLIRFLRNTAKSNKSTIYMVLHKGAYFHYDIDVSTDVKLKRRLLSFLTDDINVSCGVCYEVTETQYICECNMEMCQKCIFQYFVQHQNNTCPMCKKHTSIERVVRLNLS